MRVPVTDDECKIVMSVLPEAYFADAVISANLIAERDGEQIVQPIGSTSLTMKESFSVPATTSLTEITVSGTVNARSDVAIYVDGEHQKTVTASQMGSFKTTVELSDTFNHTYHQVYFEVTNKSGDTYTSKTYDVEFDINHVYVDKIIMSPNGHYGDYVTLYSADGDFENSYYYWPGTYDTITYQVEFVGNAAKIKNPTLVTIGDSGEKVSISLTRIGDTSTFSGVYTYNNSTFPNELYVEYDYNSEVLVDTEYIEAKIAKLEQQSAEVEQYAEEFAEACKELSDEGRAEIYSILSGLSDIGTEDIGYEVVENDDDSFVFNEINNSIQLAVREWTDTTLTAVDLLADGYEMMPTYSGENRLYCKSDKNGTVYADLSTGLFQSISYYALEEENSIASTGAPINLDDYPGLIGEGAGYLISYLERMFTAGCAAAARCFDMATKYTNEYQYWLTRGPMYSRQAAVAANTARALKCLGFVLDRVLVGLNVRDIVQDWLNCNMAQRNHDSLLSYYETMANRVEELQCGRDELRLYREAIDSLQDAITAFRGWVISQAVSTIAKIGTLLASAQLSVVSQLVWSGVDFVLMRSKNIAWDRVREWNSEAENRARDLYSTLLRCLVRPVDPTAPEETRVEPSQLKPTSPEETRGNRSQSATPLKKRDPSGYVYEAVPSNRLSGVTVTAYYSEFENGADAEIWDAEDFDQQNPLLTDSYGQYEWFVPDGYWQVKYEKDGYETAYSDWLPVPPPQMDVNIGMKSLSAPAVNGVKAYPDSAVITFSQYMNIDSVTPSKVTVTMNGEAVAGTIAPLNAETAENGKTYASEFAFTPDEGTVLSGEVGVRIALVKNYADSFIDGVYDETIAVEQRITSIDCDDTVTVDYGTPAKVKIQLNPQEAAAGKNVLVSVDNTAVLRVDKDVLTTNADGSAELMLNAQLPGAATITYTVEGTGITATTKVVCELLPEVVTPKLERVASSVPSGSAIAKGIKIRLTNSNPDAKIYYTLDMSCPCQVNNPERTLYTGPITVTENTNLIAYAVLDGYEESNTILFTYTISANSYILGDTDGNGEIEIVDATFIQRELVQIETPYTKAELMRGDVDGSGDLEIIDVTALQYYLANMKTPFIIGKPIG